MADILNLIKGNLRQINMEKLADLCSKNNLWDHFKMSKKDSLIFPTLTRDS